MLAPTLLAASAIALAHQQDTSTVRDTVLLEEYVVSRTRTAELRRIDQPLALSLTTPGPVQRTSASVAANLLRDVTGVHVQQTSAGQGSVILRGMVGNQVLLLVNGVPLNNGTYRDGPGQYLATIDPETVQRIEIVRGPASVLYGSDAQGGVVNVITAPHPHTDHQSLRVAGGASSADRSYRARFSVGAQREGWSLSLGGTVASVGDLRAGGGLGRQDPTGFSADGIDGEVRLWLGHRHAVTAVAQHFALHDVPRYDRYVTFRAPTAGPDAEHVFNPQSRQLVYIRHTMTSSSPLLARLETTVSLSMQREGRYRIQLEGNGQPDTLRTHWRDNVYTPGVSLVGSTPASVAGRPLTLTWGAEGYHDALDSHGYVEDLVSGMQTPLELTVDGGTIPTGQFPDGATADRFGAFVAADAPVSRAVHLSFGGRWTRFRNAADVGTEFGGAVANSSAELTGQLGLVVTPSGDWRVAARLAQGFRSPNLYDLTRTGPVPGGIALPNPDAGPERSISGEVSVRYAGRQLAFDVTAYTTRITDFIDRVPGTFRGDTLFDGERVFLGENVGTARIRGIEAEVARAFGPLRLRGSLTFTRGDQRGADGLDEPMSKIPPLGGHLSVRWSASPRPLWVEYVLRWATPQERLGRRDLTDPRIPDGGTPGYAVQGLRASATVTPGVQLSAGFENVLDTLYRPHASGVDGAGRHVWVGVSWQGGLE
jgi:outer membrane receptor protein involved in Fe transport